MIESIIEFWFGPLAGPEDFNRDRYEIWFRHGRAYQAGFFHGTGINWMNF